MYQAKRSGPEASDWLEDSLNFARSDVGVCSWPKGALFRSMVTASADTPMTLG